MRTRIGDPVSMGETLHRGVIEIFRLRPYDVAHVFTIDTSGLRISDSNGHRWAPHQTLFWTE